jgi:hypothetical protein
LASCSSGVVEFGRIVSDIAKGSPQFRQDPFQTMRGTLFGRDIILLNGGFPLNFDRMVEREPAHQIQLTRELTFASVMQAALCVDSSSDAWEIMLDPDLQHLLVEKWIRNVGMEYFPNWVARSVEWWKERSGGAITEIPLGTFLTVR